MACCGRAKIQQYIARHRPQDALRVTDYMDTLMLGLSAAREGDSLPRLLETVRLAALGASCQPESSDGLSARHLDPLGGYPAVIVA